MADIETPRPLTAEERAELEEMAKTNLLIQRVLDVLDIERARLSQVGGDLTSAGGGYDMAWIEDNHFGNGRLFTARSNIRQAIDAHQAYIAKMYPNKEGRPWWVATNEAAEMLRMENLDEPDKHDQWKGPVEESRGEAFTQYWHEDNAVQAMVDGYQLQLELWRYENGRTMRLARVLGIDPREDPDDWIAEHHADKFGPDFKKKLEIAQKRLRMISNIARRTTDQ